MKPKTIATAAIAAAIAASAVYGAIGERYKVITHPQVTKCWKVSGHEFIDGANPRLLKVYDYEENEVSLNFEVKNAFGVKINHTMTCGFWDDRDRFKLTSFRVNGIPVSQGRVTVLNALGSISG